MTDRVKQQSNTCLKRQTYCLVRLYMSESEGSLRQAVLKEFWKEADPWQYKKSAYRKSQHKTWQMEERHVFIPPAMRLSSTPTIRSLSSFVDYAVPPLSVFSTNLISGNQGFVLWSDWQLLLPLWMLQRKKMKNRREILWIMLLFFFFLPRRLYHSTIINSHTYLQHKFQRR